MSGLHATLKCDRETWRVGESIAFLLEIENRDTEPRNFMPVTYLDSDVPGRTERSNVSDAVLVIQSVIGRVRTQEYRKLERALTATRQTDVLQPGEKRACWLVTPGKDPSAQPNVSMGPLRPGEYHVQVIYHAAEVTPNPADRLATNTLLIRVRE